MDRKRLLALALREMGRLGGKARAKALTPGRRREIAKAAIAARWAKWRETQGKAKRRGRG